MWSKIESRLSAHLPLQSVIWDQSSNSITGATGVSGSSSVGSLAGLPGSSSPGPVHPLPTSTSTPALATPAPSQSAPPSTSSSTASSVPLSAPVLTQRHVIDVLELELLPYNDEKLQFSPLSHEQYRRPFLHLYVVGTDENDHYSDVCLIEPIQTHSFSNSS